MNINFFCTFRVSINYYIISIIIIFELFMEMFKSLNAVYVFYIFKQSLYNLYLKTKYTFDQVFIVKVSFIFST